LMKKYIQRPAVIPHTGCLGPISAVNKPFLRLCLGY
jgi:hypothetical protein